MAPSMRANRRTIESTVARFCATTTLPALVGAARARHVVAPSVDGNVTGRSSWAATSAAVHAGTAGGETEGELLAITEPELER